MAKQRENLIKGQSERSFQKIHTTSTCFTPQPPYHSIDISNSVGSHDEAKIFFTNLRKTCKSKSEEK